MSGYGRDAGCETGAPSDLLAGCRWGLDTLSQHRAQRLAARYRVRPSVALTLAALAWREVQS